MREFFENLPIEVWLPGWAEWAFRFENYEDRMYFQKESNISQLHQLMNSWNGHDDFLPLLVHPDSKPLKVANRIENIFRVVTLDAMGFGLGKVLKEQETPKSPILASLPQKFSACSSLDTALPSTILLRNGKRLFHVDVRKTWGLGRAPLFYHHIIPWNRPGDSDELEYFEPTLSIFGLKAQLYDRWPNIDHTPVVRGWNGIASKLFPLGTPRPFPKEPDAEALRLHHNYQLNQIKSCVECIEYGDIEEAQRIVTHCFQGRVKKRQRDEYASKWMPKLLKDEAAALGTIAMEFDESFSTAADFKKSLLAQRLKNRTTSVYEIVGWVDLMWFSLTRQLWGKQFGKAQICKFCEKSLNGHGNTSYCSDTCRKKQDAHRKRSARTPKTLK